jgi:hypothetical protein
VERFKTTVMLFNYVSLEARVRADQPLRAMRVSIDDPTWDASSFSKNRMRIEQA